jgi:hypothetical protein
MGTPSTAMQHLADGSRGADDEHDPSTAGMSLARASAYRSLLMGKTGTHVAAQMAQTATPCIQVSEL